MATIVELVRRGEFELLDPDLDPPEQAVRLIYVRNRVQKWILANLEGVESEFDTEVTPAEQLVDLVYAFCAGKNLTYDRQVKILRHISNHVWELKTLDLRPFGWFPRKDTFICCSIDFATRIKALKLYPGYRNEIVHFRKNLDLSPPKSVTGANPNGVLTNISFPKTQSRR